MPSAGAALSQLHRAAVKWHPCKGRYVTKRAVELDLLCSPAGKRLNDFAGGYPRNFIAIDNGYS